MKLKISHSQYIETCRYYRPGSLVSLWGSLEDEKLPTLLLNQYLMLFHLLPDIIYKTSDGRSNCSFVSGLKTELSIRSPYLATTRKYRKYHSCKYSPTIARNLNVYEFQIKHELPWKVFRRDYFHCQIHRLFWSCINLFIFKVKCNFLRFFSWFLKHHCFCLRRINSISPIEWDVCNALRRLRFILGASKDH